MKYAYLLFVFIYSINTSFSQKKDYCVSPEIETEQNEIKKCSFHERNNKNKSNNRVLSIKKNTKDRFFVKRKTKSFVVRKKKIEISKVGTNGIHMNKVINGASKKISGEELESTIADKKEFFDFEEVEEIPLFRNCERSDYEDDMDCFNTNLSNYIMMNLDYQGKINSSKKIEVVKISFIIGKDGQINKVETEGLEREKKLHKYITELIKGMTNFKPGKAKGKVVATKYSFEINLSL